MEENQKNVILCHYYEGIARICHEANRAYCITQGDNSQPSWENAPDWQKESAINGVKFHSLNEYTTPADSHKSWLKQKEEEGWKWGVSKDAELKEHPCFTAYENLPKSQQLKDYIFKGIVDAYKTALITDTKDRSLTLGEELVSISFNPSYISLVDKVKRLAADLIDIIVYDHNIKTDNGKAMASWSRNVLKTSAITAIVTAQMAAVKIITWNK